MSETQETSAVITMDSSALVKRYLLEAGTTWTKTICDTTTNVIATAEIGLVEIASAFAGKLRGGFINADEYHNARADLSNDAQHSYVLVSVNRTVVDEAIELTARNRLRGYDAVHLASALHLNRALMSRDLPSIAFVSADDDLLRAAAAEGLLIDNPNRHAEDE